MTPVRVGLVGARRANQGLGPFVARDLCRAGAEVPCFLVRHEANLAEATQQIERAAGIAASGYTDLATMLAAEKLDALAICSPHESHAAALEAAVAAGLHAFCEKPLLWGGPDLAGRAAALCRGFAEGGLELWENCQWPESLPAFEELHPGALDRPPATFSMLLQPSGHGTRMLADSLPHPLSLLQVLAPGRDPRLADVTFSSTDPDAQTVVVRFGYHVGRTRVACEVELRPTRSHPRDTRLAIDGRGASRVVAAREYALSFHCDGRSVPVPDPMARHIAGFVRAVEDGGEPDAAERRRRIVERMALLDELRAAWERAAG